jgi:hypothetical protein
MNQTSYKRERDRDFMTLSYSLKRELLNAFPVLRNENAFQFPGVRSGDAFLGIEYAI